MRWERTITVIGCHVGGEDNHVIVGGVLPPPGASMLDKKRYLETHADELRRWLLLEPRGKPTLCVNLVTPPTRPDCDVGTVSRNAVVVAPGRIDRSPCGTGTSARLAVLHARGQLAPGQGFIAESIIGSRFEAAIADEAAVGERAAIVPTIAGQAWITGVFQHGLDPSDPFRNGYTLPDLWGA